MRLKPVLVGIACASTIFGLIGLAQGKDRAAMAAPNAGPAKIAPPPTSAPNIEVCFVLDTTGSMSGLIEGAKAKIWSIANQIVSAKPAPHVKFALIGYRDRGDEYVTRDFDLTDDLDGIYSHLKEFKADGGGDTPESVNQALNEAVTKMQWSGDRSVLKIVFLVGDAPPHMDYANDVKYPDICQAAVRKDLVINTVQCGADPETTRVWKEIAKLSEGQYAVIEQQGGMQAVSTPMDKEIQAKQRELNASALVYGGVGQQLETAGKLRAAASISTEAAADRAAVMSKAYAAAPAASPRGLAAAGLAVGGSAATQPGQLMTGGGELLDDLSTGRVKLESVKAEELPPAMQKMTDAERKEYIAAHAKKRADLQKEVAELVRKRDAYIDQQRKEGAAAGRKDGFDAKVTQMIQEQADRKGIATQGK
ncbi:MAG: VWA domain-containing protein [Planctomycetota bacterium]|nr:VWA domain-containing protein [Planctomycetota bacterium]